MKEQSKVILSILILSIPERIKALERLYSKIEAQIKKEQLNQRVEILTLIDNRVSTIAEKRNALLKVHNGSHLAFVDDDDDISNNYIRSICSTLQKTPDLDVVTFNQKCLINGKNLDVTFGVNNTHEGLKLQSETSYKPIKRPPYHICVWKSNLAKTECFRHVVTDHGQSYEDIDWCIRLYPRIKTHWHIPEVLHFYNYDQNLSTSTYDLSKEKK